MNQNEIFTKTLSLSEPWHIERSNYEEDAKQLDIYVDFSGDYNFNCPKCNSTKCEIIDVLHNTWQYFNFFDNQTFVHARIPSLRCPSCGMIEIEVPWDRRNKDRRSYNDRRLNLDRRIIERRTSSDRRDSKKIF